MRRPKKSKRATAASVRTLQEYALLSAVDQERRRKAFKGLNLMRSQGLSRTAAAREAGITPAAMQKIVGSAVTKSGGRFVAKKGDNLLRFMVIPTPKKGRIEIAVRGSRNASSVAKYDNAVKHYLYTGDASLLERFAGTVINSGGKKITLLTDADELDYLAHAHALSFESIYAKVA